MSILEPEQPITFSIADPPCHVTQSTEPISSSTPVRPPPGGVQSPGIRSSSQPASSLDEFATPRRSPRKVHPGSTMELLPQATTPEVFTTPQRSPRKTDSSDTTMSSPFASASETTPPAGHVRTKLTYPSSSGTRKYSTKNTHHEHDKCKETLIGSPKLTSKALSLKSIKKSLDTSDTGQPSSTGKKLLKGLANKEGLRYTMSYVNTGRKEHKRKCMKSAKRKDDSMQPPKYSHTVEYSIRRSPRKISLNKSDSTYSELLPQYDNEANFEYTGQIQVKRKCDFSPTKSQTHIVPSLSNSYKKARDTVRKYSDSDKLSLTQSAGQGSRSSEEKPPPSAKRFRLNRSVARREAERRRSAEQSYEFSNEEEL